METIEIIYPQTANLNTIDVKEYDINGKKISYSI